MVSQGAWEYLHGAGAALSARHIEAFAQLGTELDKSSQQQLDRGGRMVELLKQGQYVPVSVEEQVVIIYAASSGALDTVPARDVPAFEKSFLAHCRSNHADLLETIKVDKKWTSELAAAFDKALADHVKEFVA